MICYLPTLSQCAQLATGTVPAPPAKGRYNRATLCGADGRGVQLTIPVAGGINAVKHAPPETWHSADEKNWRHQHLGAISAAYGRTPFFPHLFPALESILSDTSETSVAALNARLYRAMEEFLQLRALAPRFTSGRHGTAGKVAAELLDAVPAAPGGVTALHYIFHLGPDAVFCILASLNTKTE